MAYKRYGDPQVIIRMPAADRRRLEKGAELAELTISEFVREAIRKALDDLQVPRAEAEKIDGQMSIGETE